MSAFWVINRILHGVNGTPGETERDGAVWLLPLATGFIPCLGLLLLKDHVKQQGLLLLIWSLLVSFLIVLVRPEIDHEAFVSKHLESAGLSNALRSLFKYKLDVIERKTTASGRIESPHKVKSRLSVSCLIYYVGFAVTGAALIVTRPIVEKATPEQAQRLFPWVGGGIIAILTAFVAGLGMTYREEKIGWKIHEGEKQILATIYFLSTLNIIVALTLGILLPLIG